MSSKSSDSDRRSVSDDDSKFNYIPGNYSQIESEIMKATDSENGQGDKDQRTSCVDVEPYSIEPMGDEEWIAEFGLRQAEKEQRLASLKDRLAGEKSLNNWFMRSVAYREFIHLLYDRVGKNRIPLPTCAYHAIRSKFQPTEKGEHFVGFQDEEMHD